MQFDPDLLKQIYVPPVASHKGQNGKLLLIGGSHLFHAASLWALHIASRVVDMVFYASVPENNKIVQDAKEEFRNGIVVLRDNLEDYVKEADCILIGPGMLRSDQVPQILESKSPTTLQQINALEDQGMQSYFLTKYLLEKYPEKKWVIDAGALQMLDPEWLRPLTGQVLLTPHPRELERMISGLTHDALRKELEEKSEEERIKLFVKEYQCMVLLKGEKDYLYTPEAIVEIPGGNAGMTKGGTGDVLAGLIASLGCNNDLFLAAQTGSYINKKAGDALFKKVGYYFNASDLADEIPQVMKELLLSNTVDSPPEKI